MHANGSGNSVRHGINMKRDSIAVLDGKRDHEIGTCGMAIDYCILKERMSILRGRKSVPGINSNERENGKKGTTLPSRELHDKELVEANASLSKTLLGDDVSKDNFLARMAALIKRKKQALAEKLAKERKDK
nr:hypothetical protein [Tanacetum cinerariifolium]